MFKRISNDVTFQTVMLYVILLYYEKLDIPCRFSTFFKGFLGCTDCVIGLMNWIIVWRTIISIIGVTINLHDAAVKLFY